ncbi:MAG: hypothetical protein JNK15_03115 [Planctomycetes bacterium]|nr:hypothetical protein [Planctomycetota bacterium]
MNPAPVSTTGSIQFSIDHRPITAVIEGMPKAAYFWLRDFFGRAFVTHRVKWLAGKSTSFGRGGRGIRVTRINEGGTGALDPREVRYSVTPDDRRMPTTPAAVRGLQQLGAAVETGNVVLPVHEFGTDIRSGKPMFVPTFKGNQHTPRDIRKWRAKNPSKRLLFLPSKRGGDGKTPELVYEAITKRRPGRVRADGTSRPGQVKLKLRWVMRREVEMHPTLRLYDSWDDLRAERDAQFRTASDRMLQDLVRQDARDL